MNVLLVRAKPTKLINTRLPKSLSEEVGYVMPLGLASIAAYLRGKGIPVSIIDADVENLSIIKLKEKMLRISPEVVGITTMTPTIHDDLKVARIAKEIGAKVVVGGPHINAMPIETMQLFPIDFGILGEGEYPMFKLIEALSNNFPIDNVPGLIFKNRLGEIIKKIPYIHENLDELPIPARDLLLYDRYSSIITKKRFTTMTIGRGCPFNCGFCFKQPSDQKIRYRNPKLVVDEIGEVVYKYDINEINFTSDTLTFNNNFIQSFCQEMIDKKVRISWIAPTRVDCVTPELLKLMKRAGCRGLRFGVESGSAKILEYMGKYIDKKETLQAFEWARQEKIETFAYLIIGYLNETDETVRETLDFVKKIKPDLLMYNIATPLPSTRLFEQAVAAGLIDPEYWKKFLLDENYPRVPYLFKNVDKWVDLAYREFYFSPKFILKRILGIRQNNVQNYLKAVRGIMGLKKK